MNTNTYKCLLFALALLMFFPKYNAQGQEQPVAQPEPTPPAANLPGATPDSTATPVPTTAPTPPKPENLGETLAEYSYGFITDYVNRGDDLYNIVYFNRGKAEEAFNIAPAFQGSIKFFPEKHLTYTLGYTTALLERDAVDSKSFAGLSTIDELYESMRYTWNNRLGGFQMGVDYTSYPNTTGNKNLIEVVTAWKMPMWESVSPTLTFFDDIRTPGRYIQFDMGQEGENAWTLHIGWTAKGMYHFTGTRSTDILGMKITLGASYRPAPHLHPSYSGTNYSIEGTYTDPKSTISTYPNVLFWLGFSWSGKMTEREPQETQVPIIDESGVVPLN